MVIWGPLFLPEYPDQWDEVYYNDRELIEATSIKYWYKAKYHNSDMDTVVNGEYYSYNG